jgi:hypothetical protein
MILKLISILILKILAACAYNFPAVLSVVGMKKWHNFKPLYNYLLESNVRVFNYI